MRFEGGSTHTCDQRPGEVVVVPTAWWHATCNEPEFFGDKAYTLGIGGQDWCDTKPQMDCPQLLVPPLERLLNKQKTQQVCGDPEFTVACHDEWGLQLAKHTGERLYQPDLQIVELNERTQR